MATQSPFSWAAQALPDMVNRLAANFQPPAWVVDESVNRLVLFLNHVLMSEPEAMARLARQKGQRIELVWERLQLQLSPHCRILEKEQRSHQKNSRNFHTTRICGLTVCMSSTMVSLNLSPSQSYDAL